MNRLSTLLLYALPAVPLAFLGLPLYVYLPAHYADLPGIALATVGIVLLGARLLDLLTDPLVGYLTDRIRHRLRPQWPMGLGTALMLGGVWWLFRPPGDAGALYLFLGLSVTYLGWTLLAIPYYALGADLGAARGQTRVAAWREAGMIVGTLTALMLPALAHRPDALALSADALLWLAPPAAALAWLLRPRPAAAPAALAGGLTAMWRHTSRPARQVLGIHLLNALAGGTAATLFVLYARDVLGLDERASGVLLLVYFVSGLAVLPFWVALARRIGRVRTWRVAMLLAAIGFVPAALLGPGDWVLFALVCVMTGATLGADIAMPSAIQAQLVVSESRRLARPRGGALFGLWGMASKLALALAAGLALPLLDLLSRPVTGLSQAEVLPWLYAGLPVLIKLLAVLALQRSVLVTGADAGGDSPIWEETDADPTTSAPAVAADPARRV